MWALHMCSVTPGMTQQIFDKPLCYKKCRLKPNFLVCRDWVCGQINFITKTINTVLLSMFATLIGEKRHKSFNQTFRQHSGSSTWWMFFYGHHRILQPTPQKWKLASCMSELCLCTQFYTTWSSTKHTKCLVSERSVKGSKLLSWPNATLLHSRPNPRVSYSWITGWCIWPEWKTVI